MAQIKKDTSLRKAILQAAITGQLISSVVEPVETINETGKQLLDRIIEERNNKLLAEWEEALKKNPKAKKPAPIVASEIDEDEIPFEIPENWCWCKLGDICYKITDGEHNTPRRTDSFSGYYLLSARNILNGSIQLEDVDYVDEEEYLKLAKRCNPIKNDVLLSCSGTVGRCSIVNDNNKYVMVRSAAMLSPVFVNSYFLMYSIQSGFLQKQIQDSSKQTAQANLFQGAIVKLLLPLPPLAVQNAIVEKLEQVLPLVDAYENALLQKEELKSALPDKVKKAILQEAITGHLTEAWRKTATIKESGKQLLDRIIEERNAKALAEWEEALKKNPKAKKPAPIIASLQYDQDGRLLSEVEVPFEVPESWCWCRLGDLFITSSGTTPASKNPDYYVNGTINWVRTTDLNNDVLTSTEIKITEKAKEDCNLRIIPQDSVCIALYGGAGTIGKNALIKFDTTINQSVCAIHPNGFCSMKYIQWFMQWQRPNWMELASGSRKDPNINQIIVKNCLIPLPPLAEQEEIVKKVEELLPLCK